MITPESAAKFVREASGAILEALVPHLGPGARFHALGDREEALREAVDRLDSSSGPRGHTRDKPARAQLKSLSAALRKRKRNPYSLPRLPPEEFEAQHRARLDAAVDELLAQGDAAQVRGRRRRRRRRV